MVDTNFLLIRVTYYFKIAMFIIFVATRYNSTGITYMGKRDHLHYLDKQIRKIASLNHRKSMGILPTNEETNFMLKLGRFIAERAKFKEVSIELQYREIFFFGIFFYRFRSLQVEINFIDVTTKMQKLVDMQGGLSFRLDNKTFDPNVIFGNPSPHGMKLLEVDLICTGHDSEDFTDKREMTISGYPRNVIPGKNGRFVICCHDLDEEEERTRIAEMLAKEERRKIREARLLAKTGISTSGSGKEYMSINFNYGSSNATSAFKLSNLMTSR